MARRHYVSAGQGAGVREKESSPRIRRMGDNMAADTAFISLKSEKPWPRSCAACAREDGRT